MQAAAEGVSSFLPPPIFQLWLETLRPLYNSDGFAHRAAFDKFGSRASLGCIVWAALSERQSPLPALPSPHLIIIVDDHDHDHDGWKMSFDI